MLVSVVGVWHSTVLVLGLLCCVRRLMPKHGAKYEQIEALTWQLAHTEGSCVWLVRCVIYCNTLRQQVTWWSHYFRSTRLKRVQATQIALVKWPMLKKFRFYHYQYTSRAMWCELGPDSIYIIFGLANLVMEVSPDYNQVRHWKQNGQKRDVCCTKVK